MCIHTCIKVHTYIHVHTYLDIACVAGVVDGCIDLVLRGQGPDRPTISSIAASCEKTNAISEKKSPDRRTSVRRELDYSQFKDQLNAEDAELLRDLPGRYQLIYNEATGFEYSGP